MASRNHALARARYSAGNQKVRYTRTPGRKPASVIPTRTLSTYRLVGPVANMVADEARPHATMMVAIHRLTPTMSSITLLGRTNTM
ncbi:hypothetical protein D3C81_1602280 [compost metagenome]